MSDEKPPIETDLIFVDKIKFTEALTKLHWYYGELLGNLEMVAEMNNPEWTEDLARQVEHIKIVYESFVNCTDGDHKKPTSTLLN